MLKVDKPIVFFDLETTGTRVHKDEIVQIAMVKVGNEWEELSTISMLVKPSFEIPDEATAVNGITNGMVENQPKFGDIAWSINEYVGESTLAGYYNKDFDNCIFARQIGQCLGYDKRLAILNRPTIDVCLMNTRLNKRQKLTAAYKDCMDIDLENAHDALADVRATIQVCRYLCEKYNIEQTERSLIHETEISLKPIAEKQYFVKNGEDMVFNFGKHVNKTLQQVCEEAPSYLDFVLLGSFPDSAKNEINEFLSKR